jgi:hypothetical protein
MSLSPAWATEQDPVSNKSKQNKSQTIKNQPNKKPKPHTKMLHLVTSGDNSTTESLYFLLCLMSF